MEDINVLYARSYKEVLTILSLLSDDEWNKIPNDKKELYFNSMDKEYDFELDYEKAIEEQELLLPTKAILANIYRDYLATPEEKEEILHIEEQQREQIETEKREKYDPNNIFKKDNVENIEQISDETLLPTVIKKESLFSRIINKIKNLFNK